MKTIHLFALLCLTLLAPLQRAAAAVAYSLNEKIEVNTLGSWDKATIIAVGKGEHEGEYKVHYDGWNASYDRWLMPVYFRKLAGAPASTETKSTAKETAVPAPEKKDAAATAPRAGKYNISSYGRVGSPPLFLGHIQLQSGGKYRISRKASGDYYGEGRWSFDAASSSIQWLSGPCKDDNWSGTFSVEGKTHKIRLRSTTIATCTEN